MKEKLTTLFNRSIKINFLKSSSHKFSTLQRINIPNE